MVFLEYSRSKKKIIRIIPKTIKAAKYDSKKKYYDAILKSIKKVPYDFLVVENYKKAQSNATTETSELIGIIEFVEPKLYKQWNHEIKVPRFKEANLINRGILTNETRHYRVNGKQIDGHGRDALRHALRFVCKHTKHALKEMEVSWQTKKNSL